MGKISVWIYATSFPGPFLWREKALGTRLGFMKTVSNLGQTFRACLLAMEAFAVLKKPGEVSVKEG